MLFGGLAQFSIVLYEFLCNSGIVIFRSYLYHKIFFISLIFFNMQENLRNTFLILFCAKQTCKRAISQMYSIVTSNTV